MRSSRHALPNYRPGDMHEFHTTARNKITGAHNRLSIIDACWVQATFWKCHDTCKAHWVQQARGRWVFAASASLAGGTRTVEHRATDVAVLLGPVVPDAAHHGAALLQVVRRRVDQLDSF